jgi:hypothetical protein
MIPQLVLQNQVQITIEKGVHVVRATQGGRTIWRGVRAEYHPWKLAKADVDGNRRDELIVGLYMRTRHDPKPLHTLFVYGCDGRSIYPMWRGSRLARDFVDFAVLRSAGRDNILTLDRLLDGQFALSRYDWTGFGFRKRWERGAWKRARLKQTSPTSLTVVTESGVVEFSAEG